MAELHAKEAPERVRELEAWGALFDWTPDGRILQRNFGGHRYPRLAHVGDRTGLEMIRTLQDYAVQRGIEVYMEHTILTLLTEGLGNADIGERLAISEKTVRNHISKIYDKLGVWTRAQAMVFARDHAFRG